MPNKDSLDDYRRTDQAKTHKLLMPKQKYETKA